MSQIKSHITIELIEIICMLNVYFKNDTHMLDAWLKTENPNLGNSKPITLMDRGRGFRVHQFIRNQLIENGMITETDFTPIEKHDQEIEQIVTKIENFETPVTYTVTQVDLENKIITLSKDEEEELIQMIQQSRDNFGPAEIIGIFVSNDKDEEDNET